MTELHVTNLLTYLLAKLVSNCNTPNTYICVRTAVVTAQAVTEVQR